MEDFYVVGLGSSAGGMQSLFDFFSNTSEMPGAAYVVVPHLNRDYHSILSFLIQKKTDLKTKAIENGDIIERDHIYVLPENKKVTITKGVLLLKERPEEEKINKAIDTFFISLAEEKKERAVGIIFSGMGSDGTEGAIQIKKKGGIVLVQDPATSDFTRMPLNVIQFDHPDAILAPSSMPGYLKEIFKNSVEINRR